MRALILCNKFPYPATDGSSIAIMRMIDTLLAANIEVSLFSLNTQKHFKDANALKTAYADKLSVISIDVLTNITASNTLANLLTGQPFHVSRFYVSEVSKKLEALLQKETFDIIQFEGIFMGPYLDLVRKHSDAKCVLRPHNIEYRIWERFIKSEKNILKSLYLQIQTRRLKKYELEIIPQFDGIVPISDADKKFIELKVLKPIVTIPCATDLNTYNEAPSEKANFFHIGAMDWMPNVSGIEWFLEKATEIGIDEITPIICDNSERKFIKPERLKKIIISAMKQSLKFHLPKLNEVVTISEFLKHNQTQGKYIAHCVENEKPLMKDVLLPQESSTILIGPEGDFSFSEIEKSLQKGYTPITLGEARLRTETAALVSVMNVSFINQ